MKFQKAIIALLCVLFLSGLAGCSVAGMASAGDAAQKDLAAAAEGTVQAAPAPGKDLLTPEQARAIALEHAGFTADQVQYLRTEYEIDDGVPQYEVQFHQDRWEYDYEINAETGAIQSYDRDD